MISGFLNLVLTLLFWKQNLLPINCSISKGMNKETLVNNEFVPSFNENNSPLPYNYFGMLKSNSSISNVNRNGRIYFSSFPNVFNLAFFGNMKEELIFTNQYFI